MPGSYQEASEILKPFLIPLEKYDVCVNDCIIFRNEHIDDDKCFKCEEPRFLNRRPRRTFTYLPIGPRIARMIGSPSLASLLTQDREEREIIRDIQDTTTWKNDWFSDGLFKGRIGELL